MADVVFGFVYDLGPGEEWVAERGAGATLDGVRLDPSIGERRNRAGKLELVGIESADPRWVREAADALVETSHRLRAMGTIAVTLCQVAGARLDGMVTLRGCARRRRRRGPADRPRGRRPRRLHGLRRAARRPAGPRAALARGRRAHARGARAARSGSAEVAAATMGRVIDWTLASQVARGVSRLQPAGDPAPFEALDGPSEESERLVSAYTGLVPDAPLPVAEAVGRDEWAEANLASLRGVLDPVADRLGGGLGPLSGIVGSGLSAAAGGRGGGDLRLPRGPRARPVRVPDPRPRRARAPAVRGPEPRPRRRRARRRVRPAAALGRAARDHARAPVRRGAVAARAPLRERAGAARRHVLRRRQPAADPRRRRPQGARGHRARGRDRHAGPRPGAARAVRPHAGADGGAGGLRGARHGRGRRRRARRSGLAPRRARSPAAREVRLHAGVRAPDRHGHEAAPVRARQALLRRASSRAAASRRSTASGPTPRRCPRSPSWTTRPAGWTAPRCSAPATPRSI